MKKVIVLILSLAMMFACGALLTSCGGSGGEGESGQAMQVGLVCLHDENSGYDLNFINGFKEACEEEGIEYQIKTNIPEGQECYDAAAELVDSGCGIVFSDSYGHQPYMIQAATDFPDVQFVSCTGDRAKTEGLDNFHNAFATIYEGRYLAGVAAGMKLNEMIDEGKITKDQAKMGYVGALTYAEVISGYTSFYLGAKSICPDVTMEVTFTGSWLNETAEKEAANKLIDNGCVLISQHADSMGAPTACEKAGVPDVSYNGSTIDACPNTYIISSRINWTPYYKYAIEGMMNEGSFDTDWTGTRETESVLLTEINDKVAAKGTQEKIDEVAAKLDSGEIKVFDTSTFTVSTIDEKTFTNLGAKTDADGHLTSYMADVEYDEKFTGDTEAVKDGYFHESEFRSAPYFNVQIDGIKLLDTKFEAID
ncbi:MAG: BMP family ABC transporter substrate-binding protein [Firmicutes bacterium]|nr:BMP family ABC transporter substrate-binding protein [Bacillota bacterium]